MREDSADRRVVDNEGKETAKPTALAEEDVDVVRDEPNHRARYEGGASRSMNVSGSITTRRDPSRKVVLKR